MAARQVDMAVNRRLTWEGCINVRDLGGLSTCDGRVTRWGAVVRSDNPSKLTAAGWSALYAHGIRTIISLRTDGQIEDVPDTAPRPSDLTTIQVAVEDLADAAFVQQWVVSDLWGTPLYYRDALRRWPDRHVAAIAAVARARPGGVLIHCGRGHDRTGIIAMLLLALVGVSPDDIVADYELSLDPRREELVAREHTSVRDAILATLAWLDIDTYLREGGLSQDDLAAVRTRLLEPIGTAVGGKGVEK
jgi:protein-tyrosine phosphatase